MKSFFRLAAGAIAVLAVSCASAPQAAIEGSWVEQVPDMPGIEQGFTLETGGKAASINMATLQYNRWERRDDVLLLSGRSLGNGQTIDFTDTLQIKHLTPDSLIVVRGTMERTYLRQ